MFLGYKLSIALNRNVVNISVSRYSEVKCGRYDAGEGGTTYTRVHSLFPRVAQWGKLAIPSTKPVNFEGSPIVFLTVGVEIGYFGTTKSKFLVC